MKTMLCTLCIFFSFSLFAKTVTAITDDAAPGNWNSANTWSTGSRPDAGDRVIIPAGKGVLINNQPYSVGLLLFIEVAGTLHFSPSGKLHPSLLSYVHLEAGGRILPRNGASSQLITIAGITKYNAANNGTLYGPAIAHILTGASVPGQPYSGFDPYVLPVALADFTAREAAGGIQLQWSTAAEEGLEAFIIERSADEGQAWTALGRVGASGAASYTYTDRLPWEGSTALYRLRLSGPDDRYSYSPVARVAAPKKLEWKAAPNPASGHVVVSFPGSGEEVRELRLLNTLGEVQKTLRLRSGTRSATLSLSDLPRGTYILIAAAEKEVIGRQLILVQ